MRLVSTIIGAVAGLWSVFCVLAFVFAIAGWIMNILNLVFTDWTLESVEGALMLVGVAFPPLGAVMGWLV